MSTPVEIDGSRLSATLQGSELEIIDDQDVVELGPSPANRALILDVLPKLAAAALFALFVAPSFISYVPYRFSWDDADYFTRCILVSRAFWSGNLRGLGAMVSYHPPAITWMGIPWGQLQTWTAAANCFVTLAIVISLFAVAALYILLRIGVRPAFLLAAALCVCASLGPFPAASPANFEATSFKTDCMLGWISLVAILLIPFEFRIRSVSTKAAAARGVFWGLTFSLGLMTKTNFSLFVSLIVPVLILIKLRREGIRCTCASLIAMAFTSAPFAFYLLRYGKIAFTHAKASSFGWISGFYYVPLSQFVSDTIHQSPGLVLWLAATGAAFIYVLAKGRFLQLWLDLIAPAIMLVFAAVVLSSPNREFRFLFPAILALPFLAAVLLSSEGKRTPSSTAAISAGFALLILAVFALPVSHRASRESLDRCDEVLSVAVRHNAQQIVLATDGPTLNPMLMDLDRALFPSGFPSIGALGWSAATRIPIAQDFQTISNADMVVFQDESALNSGFTNPRVPDYEKYARRVASPPVHLAQTSPPTSSTNNAHLRASPFP